MLFMAIFTWEPEKRDEVLKRRATEEMPERVEIIGEWVDISLNRVFRLIKAQNPEVIFATSFFWSDIGKTEPVLVMETEEIMKLIQKV